MEYYFCSSSFEICGSAVQNMWTSLLMYVYVIPVPTSYPNPSNMLFILPISCKYSYWMLQSWSSNPNLKLGPRHIQSRLSQSKVSMSAVFFTFSRYFRLANASDCSAALQFWAQHLSLWLSPVCTWDINLHVLILKYILS